MIFIKKTNSLALATVLLSRGYSLKETYKNDSGRITFVFNVDAGADDVTRNFYLNRLRCEPNSLFASLKQLKDIIHVEKTSER